MEKATLLRDLPEYSPCLVGEVFLLYPSPVLREVFALFGVSGDICQPQIIPLLVFVCGEVVVLYLVIPVEEFESRHSRAVPCQADKHGRSAVFDSLSATSSRRR